ncbi:SPW repeat protein [uncultured Sulfitobacter sp.]|uniref:SPW repeat domain-containing protein n=1 Tax=uncultured Sulfitobacter sp. TaxID=191468 RepID=UPI0034275190
MPPYLGLVLGLGVFLAPWLAEFADRLVTWNAAVIGVILSVVAFFELLHDQPAPSNR